jgi:hypothetical protein
VHEALQLLSVWWQRMHDVIPLSRYAGEVYLAAPRDRLWIAIKAVSLLLELCLLVFFNVLATWILIKGHLKVVVSEAWQSADGIVGKLVRVGGSRACRRGCASGANATMA